MAQPHALGCHHGIDQSLRRVAALEAQLLYFKGGVRDLNQTCLDAGSHGGAGRPMELEHFSDLSEACREAHSAIQVLLLPELVVVSREDVTEFA